MILRVVSNSGSRPLFSEKVHQSKERRDCIDTARIYSPPSVDRLYGIWGSYYNIPAAIFYLLKGDYKRRTASIARLFYNRQVPCLGRGSHKPAETRTMVTHCWTRLNPRV